MPLCEYSYAEVKFCPCAADVRINREIKRVEK